MSIRHKRTANTGYVWQTTDLAEGQIGLNLADGTLHFKKSNGSINKLEINRVPLGGLPGEYLVKNTASDFDLIWTDRVAAKTISQNCKNVSGTTLTKGTPVYAVNVVGNTITVDAARADDPSKMPAIGVLGQDLADQTEGELIVLGEIKGVDTSSFVSGQEIYVGTTGGFTNVKPTGMNTEVQFLGIVVRIDAVSGNAFVLGTGSIDQIRYNGTGPEIWNGTQWITLSTTTSLDGLSDVTITAPTTGQVLKYNGTDWINAEDAGGAAAISIADEGTELTNSVSSINFTGAGVTATNTGNAVTVTIPGGGGGAVVEPLSMYRDNMDSMGVFTVLEYKRADGTLAKTSTLSGGSSPNYTTRTVNNYAADGTTVTSTETYALTYNGLTVTSEVLQ